MMKPKVLFLCSDNSARSQMAEAFLRDMAGERFEALSAGLEATGLDPEAVAAMQEVGLDISGQQPKKVDQFLRERVAYLVTLCDRQIERAPARVSPARPGGCNGRWKIRLLHLRRKSAANPCGGYATKSGRG